VDNEEDGYGVRLRVKNVTKDPDVTEYSLTNSFGEDSSIGRNQNWGQPYNLAEKDCFRLTMWLINNGKQVGDKYYVQVRNYNEGGPRPCAGVD
jgi:hypothetical protein